MTARYRKRPVVIEAAQWLPGDLVAAGRVIGWLMAHNVDFFHETGRGKTTTIEIRTLEGVMTGDPGDWIIRGVKGEFYPCKPDIFAATYEPVEEPPGEPA